MNYQQDFFKAVQQVARQTVDAHEPSDICLGVVVSESPLSIRLEAGDVLTEEFLELTDAVRDYHVDIEVNHLTENRAGGGGYAEFASHNHQYLGRKKITVYNGLHVGETVIMQKQAGGQSFVVISRNKDHAVLTGQWG